MKATFLNLWLVIRYSYWFVPTLMAGGAIALSFVMIALDDLVKDKWVHSLGWIYAMGPEGARAVLATVAGSMIGVTGVVFSITIVTLTLASSQFGPRLLRNFMRDTGNQIVLGTFIATFTYCLLVLRTVQGTETATFVPSLSVALGVVLALLSLGVLIYFIHHVSASIQADSIIAAVSQDIDSAVNHLFPQELGHGASQGVPIAHHLPPGFDRQACPIVAMHTGYLQALDGDRLVQIASTRDLLLCLECRPGQFIVSGRVLARAWPATRVDEELTNDINNVLVLGDQRTYEQDPEFAFSQLVEIAIRALSPGINDPYTAIACLDRLASGLCRVAERELPSMYRTDAHRALRVIAPQITFVAIADSVFTPIRQYSQSSSMVTRKLLETIALVATCVHREEDLKALLRQATMIERGSYTGLPEEWDRQQIADTYASTVQALERQAVTCSVPHEENAP